MKIFLAIVMVLTVSSVWAGDCGDITVQKDCKDSCQWKSELAAEETKHCIKTISAQAGQTTSVCPAVVTSGSTTTPGATGTGSSEPGKAADGKTTGK